MKLVRGAAGLLPLSTVLAVSQSAPSAGLEIIKQNNVRCSRPTQSGDMIAVHYRGTLQSDGSLFDESYGRGEPIVFPLGRHQVISGWDQGLLDMCPGEKRKLVIPPELAYGDRGTGPIPPQSTLVFETELVEIMGVTQEMLTTALLMPSATAVGTNGGVELSIATAPPLPPTDGAVQEEEVKPGNEQDDVDALVSTPLSQAQDKDEGGDPTDNKKAECQLLGPFALIVQAALGAIALLSLVWKRYREKPKRPWKIFFFDVSKQVLGSMLTHVLNLAMSMLGSVEIVNAVQQTAATQAVEKAKDMPNPCSYYLLNLAIDTTLGIPVLFILLKVLHAFALRTPLARPPQSIKSGIYDQPPRATWWLKQLLIYFLGLVGMKLFVLFLFKAMPWLPWIGDWALRWTRGNEALEVTFVMFIFPLVMNGLQYWIIDSLIKDNGHGGGDYQQVEVDEDEGDERRFRQDMHDSDDLTEVSNDDTIVVGADQLKDGGKTSSLRRGPGSKGQGSSPTTRSMAD